jgi:Uncharacterised nucleotidyltransferase
VSPSATVEPRFWQIADLEHSPELELLLLCARRNLSADRAQRARELLEQPLDWRRLIEQGRVHGLLPLLYWHGTRTLAQELPREIARQLHDHFRANAARNLLLIDELFKIVELLDGSGIPVVPFKGPALAEQLYGDAALRECVDLDILLRARDVPEAIRRLKFAGYSQGPKLTAVQQNAFLTTQYEYAFLSPAGILVELQWRIAPQYFSLSLPEEHYWDRIQSATMCGREVNQLSCEDLLLLLSFHGGKHGWEKLIWLADVAELIAAHPQLDWDYVLNGARRTGGLRMLLLSAALARELLGIALPKHLEQPLAQDRAVPPIADGIARNVLRGEQPTYVKSQLYLLRVRERWQDRLRYVVRFTFTATPMELEMADFPRPFFFLYRCLRVLRGLRKALALVGNTAARFIERKV